MYSLSTGQKNYLKATYGARKFRIYGCSILYDLFVDSRIFLFQMIIIANMAIIIIGEVLIQQNIANFRV